MLKKLRLERFKNFRDAELQLGPLTLLIGENATGKSNLRDAFRFLHGIGRGYSVAEIIGEKWIEGGVLQWKGIRGGSREVSLDGSPNFALELHFQIDGISTAPTGPGTREEASYRIEVAVGSNGRGPQVVAERLVVQGQGSYVFDSHPSISPPKQELAGRLWVRLSKPPGRRGIGQAIDLVSSQPALTQIAENADAEASTRSWCRSATRALSSMRFLDLDPVAMRRASLPGQTILGDQGENLSSVLQAICDDPRRKSALLRWVQDLTPMEAVDFEFPTDQVGRVLLRLAEDSGQRTTADSSSDGTLRLLAMIAALLGPDVSQFYFFEDIENGIHPTRLFLLMRLIEQQVVNGAVQIVATTHSPGLLREISRSAIDYTSMTYRIRGQREAHISRILDIPDARRVVGNQDVARLHESGWFEDIVNLMQDEDAKVAR